MWMWANQDELMRVKAYTWYALARPNPNLLFFFYSEVFLFIFYFFNYPKLILKYFYVFWDIYILKIIYNFQNPSDNKYYKGEFNTIFKKEILYSNYFGSRIFIYEKQMKFSPKI
jgi:hypothetical protein